LFFDRAYTVMARPRDIKIIELPRTNTLAYFAGTLATKKKVFFPPCFFFLMLGFCVAGAALLRRVIVALATGGNDGIRRQVVTTF
jgi:hypothetical protein